MSADHEEAPRRRGGRPPSRKRGTFSFRVTAELREKLEASAAASGRPVSEEIETRLDQSYYLVEAVRESGKIAADHMKSKLVSISGGPEGWEAGRIFGNEFSAALAKAARKHNLAGKWYDDPDIVRFIQEAMVRSAGDIVEKTADLERWLEQARRPLTDEEIERISETLDAPPVWELARTNSTDDMSQEHGSEKLEATKSDKEVQKNK